MQRVCVEVLPLADTATALLYERQIVLTPPLWSLFHSSRREQGCKLMAMLHMVVAGLSWLEALVPIVQHLGVRHPGRVGKRGKSRVLQL
jgi:hypothetical protein